MRNLGNLYTAGAFHPRPPGAGRLPPLIVPNPRGSRKEFMIYSFVSNGRRVSIVRRPYGPGVITGKRARSRSGSIWTSAAATQQGV